MLEEKSHQLKRGPCPHPLLPYIKKNGKVVFLVNLLIWSANGIAILKKCKILSSTLKTFSSFRMWLWGNLPLGPYPFSIGHPINPYMADYFHITGPLEDCDSSSQSGFFSVSRERGMQYVEFINYSRKSWRLFEWIKKQYPIPNYPYFEEWYMVDYSRITGPLKECNAIY